MSTGIQISRPLRLVAALALSLAGICAIASAGAQAALPAWKLAAATGPTNLPKVQSEVQQLMVEADGGTFTLSRPGNEGEGTSVTGSGRLTYLINSNQATIVEGTFEVGEKITGAGLRANPSPGTIITACSPDCSTPGSILTLSLTTSQARTNQLVNILRKQLTNVTGTFFVGDELSGPSLQPETFVTAVEPQGPGTLGISKAPLGNVTQPLKATQRTVPLDYNAASGVVQTALEDLPLLGAGSVVVTGGPGGSVDNPYSIQYGGPLSNQDVPQLTGNGGELTGDRRFASVSTTVPGGLGTGEIAVYPTNVGGAPSSSGEDVTVTVGPLPAGIVVSGAAKGDGWTCTTLNPSEVSCIWDDVVAPNRPTSPMGVPVQVQPSAPSVSEVEVEISGGGAQPAGQDTVSVPLVVSANQAPAGIAAFWAGSFDADGQPSVQAGGHAFGNMTMFLVNTARSGSGQIVPAGDLKDVIVDLPPGFVGNPMITAKRCPQGLLGGGVSPSVCDGPEASVGRLGVNAGALGPIGALGGAEAGFALSNLINNVPVGGSAAEFSALFGTPIVSLIGSVRSSDDFGIRISAPNAPGTFSKSFATFTAISGSPENAGGKAFFRNSTSCAEEARKAPVETIEVSSWQNRNVFDSASQPLEPVTGCDKLEFEPEFSLQPTSTKGSSGVGVTAHLHMDQSGLSDPNELGAPDLKRSVVTLPEGFTVNPAQATGLQACSEAQVGYVGTGELPNPTRFNEAPVSCPDGSKLGTITATSPLLEEPLNGTIYLAEQYKNPFNSLIGLYIVIESPRFGVTLKLPGKADIDRNTGQITATFDYVPQQPVEDMVLKFRGGGPRSEFATPEVCGDYATTGVWTPWSAPESGPPAETRDPFAVSSGCSPSLATRPFRPSFEAGAVNPVAGAFSPLVIKINRNDGEQELRTLDFTLPPGLVGKLAGVPYCSEEAIAAAGSRTGKEELASPSCAAASQIGRVDVGAGVGSQPYQTTGKVYLAGPYKGAPLSAVTVTPAVAGPFDLGNVVVRAPLAVDLETAQITAKSDPIPTILEGIPLKVRSVVITVDRPEFSLNPTNCEAMAVSAALGSSNGATATPSNRFQVGGCENLRFKPKLKMQLKGPTKRDGHPSLKATLTMPEGNANIARAQVGLPHSAFLDQANLDKVCTQPELKSGTCPKSSVYGRAKAWSPLLDRPLEGPVYLGVGYGHLLPDLVADLDGQIRVLVHAKIDTTKQNGIRSTFEVVPDAPVSRFILQMKGGKKYGLLVNSENICRKPQRASARFVAHNGRVAQLRPRIANSCKKKPGKKAQKRHRRER